MLFRPNFCANCGEKIERVDWGPFTSRRFCPVCESEFKGQDLIPRAIVGAGILVGIFGIGAYLKNGSPQANALALRQPTKAELATPPVNPPQTTAANNVQLQTPPDAYPAAKLIRQQLSAGSNTVATIKPQVEAAEPMYYCGAETKKGTPCSRRVKGNVRCYQHKGMPSMLPPDKLRIG